MRRVKLLGGGAVLAVALMLAAIPASGASAAVLELSHEGKAVPVGSPAAAGLSIAECVSFSEGTVTVNGAEVDKAVFTKRASAEEPCPPGVTETGFIKEALVSVKGTTTLKGKVTFKGKIVLKKPEGCKYKFASFKGTFTPGGFVTFSGTATGKRYKSAESCLETIKESFFADVANEPFGEPFEGLV